MSTPSFVFYTGFTVWLYKYFNVKLNNFLLTYYTLLQPICTLLIHTLLYGYVDVLILNKTIFFKPIVKLFSAN